MNHKTKLGIGFIIIIALHFLSGCSESKQIAKAKQRLDSNPIEAAKYCAAKFPVKEQVIFTPGAIRIDTVWQAYSDYVPFDCPPSDTVVTYKVDVKFKEKIITRTVTDTITIVRENTARVDQITRLFDQAQSDNTVLIKRLKAANKEISYWWAFLIACFVAFGIWGYFRIKAGAISSILSKLK